MAEQYYKEALKRGQRDYRARTARGLDPYLPVLDKLLPEGVPAKMTDLGVVQVPAEFIVGTRTAGRTTSFSYQFMPLLDSATEFAAKWQRLCTAHLQEGIRDPIKVCEYRNRYYVEEGNKRVSVLKFFGAVTIPAQVRRIVPPRDGSRETEIYYEFVQFYKYSKVNFIEFTKQGSYAALQRLLGKAPEEPWTDEERSRFSTTYYYFRQAYDANGGKKLRSTVGDAMLAYMKVYGYHELRAQNVSEMKKALAKVWDEITLQQEEQPIDLKLDPDGDKKHLLPKVVLPVGSKELRVAFLHDKTPQTSGWTFAHELGRQHVQRVFKGQIITTTYENAMSGDPAAVIKQAIEEKNTVLFTTSPQLLPASLRLAVEYPQVSILNCSLNKSHRYIRTYYARMYEVKFIIGAIAGALAEHDRVGYICDYPIYGMIAGINAFARGVQMTNPRANVYLEWACVGGTAEAMRRLTDRGIDLISSQDMNRPEGGEKPSFGLARVSSDGQVNLAMPVWHWGVYYESIIRRILNRTFQAEEEVTGKALNYYWGLSAGVVDIICSDHLPSGTRKLAEVLRRAICTGICHPFYAPLRAQDGSEIQGYFDQVLSPEQIINMDWLAENVIGAIPSYEQLSEAARATVDMVGIDILKREKRG